MKDTVFVQFKADSNLTTDGMAYRLTTCLHNGFSNTHHICKEFGDMVWVDSDEMDLPDVHGTIYISALFHRELIKCLEWAKHHPQAHLIIGGPAVWARGYCFEESVPPNVELYKGTVEEFFGCGASKEWDIELPTSENNYYLFSYTTARRCYWRRCNFCSYPKYSDLYARGLDGLHIPDTKTQLSVWFASHCLSPEFIANEFSKLPNINGRYFGFVRADDAVLGVLEKALQVVNRDADGKSLIRLCFGVECPSDRMLQWMDKGTTVDNLLKITDLLVKYDCPFTFSLIEGWTNLEASDVQKVQEFCYKINSLMDRKLRVRLNPLSLVDCQDADSIVLFKRGGFKYVLQSPRLNGIQRKLNEELRKIYEESFLIEYFPLEAENTNVRT